MESLGKIFGSPARLKMLRLFVFNRDTLFPSAEIVRRTNLSKETVRRELGELTASRLVLKRGEGASLRYKINLKFEHLESLETFIRDTTIVHPQRMTTLLKKVGNLRLVALSGLFMGIIESQVDLLVVGDNISERALASAVHVLEAEMGREIRYSSFNTADFRYRLGVYDRLIRDVFDYPHRLLIDKIGL
jgi:hypothetical protein